MYQWNVFISLVNDVTHALFVDHSAAVVDGDDDVVVIDDEDNDVTSVSTQPMIVEATPPSTGGRQQLEAQSSSSGTSNASQLSSSVTSQLSSGGSLDSGRFGAATAAAHAQAQQTAAARALLQPFSFGVSSLSVIQHTNCMDVTYTWFAACVVVNSYAHAPLSCCGWLQAEAAQLDLGDDGIVPSTPTLFMPKRGDGFAEAVRCALQSSLALQSRPHPFIMPN